jgi:hypothetical protein
MVQFSSVLFAQIRFNDLRKFFHQLRKSVAPDLALCPAGQSSICHGHLSVERRKRDRGMAFHHGTPYQPSQCPTSASALVSQP